MEYSRRNLLGLGASVATAAAFGLDAAQAKAVSPPSLDALARRGGRRFGTCLGTRNGGAADSRYRDLVASQCGLIVPENELKWGWLRRTPTSFDFEAADRLLAYAERRGLAMRGHNLLWHHPKWLPAWVDSYDFGARPASAAEHMLGDHIATVCRRYGTRIGSWDVVNEAVDDHTGLLRETAFSRAMGGAEPVLDLAFHAARAAVPNAQLVYNDYMSFEPGNAAFRDGVLRLLDGFRKRAVPVDALGIQSHIGPGADGDSSFAQHEREWRAFVDRVVAMGYGLLITELDVSDRSMPAAIPARDRAVANYARPYLEAMLGYSQLGDVLVWGLGDKYSWLQTRAPRPDGLLKRPCPYDTNLRSKPLRASIAASFAEAAPHRRHWNDTSRSLRSSV